MHSLARMRIVDPDHSLLLPFDCPAHFEPGRPIIRISPGGTRVLVSSHPSDDWAVVLDVPSGKPVRQLKPSERLTGALFLDENRLALFATRGNSVVDLGTQGEAKWKGEPIPGSDGWTSHDPILIVAGGRGVFLYDVAARKTVQSFRSPLEWSIVTKAGLSPDSRYLAAEVSEDCRCFPLLGVWDLASGRLRRLYETASDRDSRAIAVAPSARLLAVGVDDRVEIYGAEHAEPIGPSIRCFAESLRFSASGRSLEVVEFYGKVSWVDPQTGQRLREAPPPEGHKVTGCAVSGQGLAAGVAGEAVLLWQLPTWDEASQGTVRGET
jgi:hypothetical protein